MTSWTLSNHQRAIAERPVESKIFLAGPSGTGKTTAGVARLLHLLDSGVPARFVLVIVPQRTLATPYYEALHRPTVGPGGQVTIVTIGGLARRMVDLFWPLVAEEAGFAKPNQPPIFLTLETAQYYMARLVHPLLDEGYFETIVIDRNRLYSQIVDNLNKAAVVGFPYTEIGERLKAAWGGEQSQRRIYDEAQACATRFREHCLAHNLLDFSLQLEVFTKYLWSETPAPSVHSSAGLLCRSYLLRTYTHVIADNVEEDTPVAHDLLREWLDECQSALLIYDDEAGYRRFLGADPESARALGELCNERVVFTDSFVTSPDLQALGSELAHILNHSTGERDGREKLDLHAAMTYEHHRYHPEMLDWVAEEIARLVHDENTPPGEIAVLAPFLTDALRFSLTNRLAQHEIPARSHRPSRALREEPATRCLLTLATIAHPEWSICPSRFDVAYALMQAIDGMDLVRAQLLTDIVYRVRDDVPTLGSFDQIKPAMQERLTFVLGGRYEQLRGWIAGYVAGPQMELDHFLSRLFGEVLSQDGYRFHSDYDAGRVAANLIESVRKFRWVAGEETRFFDVSKAAQSDKNLVSLGQEYLEMVQDGVIAAQYMLGWQLQPEDAVLLAPAYTFLMNNRPVDYQFWLNVGGRGWWERLYQPLTHPYVLSRHWPPGGDDGNGATWTDTNEVKTRQDALYRLTLGLIRRCRRKVYLGLSELGEQGYEQKGALLHAIQRILRRQGQ
ncbi:MAG: DEAD/DEAH box helicase family protein [Anaerolineae bacterium]